MAQAPGATSDTATPAPSTGVAGLLAPRRSLGLKLLLVCLLAFLMSIPALFVFGLLMDRTHRAETVATEVGGLMGGPQTFLGPVIAVPYTRVVGEGLSARSENSVWHIFPTQGRIEAATASDVRRRSLFKVPVYQAELNWTARFDLTQAGREAPQGANLDWSRAEILVGASDPRGARSDISLSLGGRAVSTGPSIIEPTSGLIPPDDGRNVTVRGDGLKLFGAPLKNETGAVLDRSGSLDVSGKATFTGARRITLLAFAGTTTAMIRGDWKSPSFNGGFLPAGQSVKGDGFNADWSVPYVARGVPAEGGGDALSRLGATEMGVSFVEPANPYQSVSRSLKYAPMFIGLVFLAFFLFETTTGRRVHAAQYILIGLAQVIFYMLLLSIGEHLGFDPAFLIAAVATVGLISAYAGWTFESRAQGVRALVAFTFLYGLIYVLMRLEDYALLVGAVASFAAIAAVMYFTRRIDWYGVTGQTTSEGQG